MTATDPDFSPTDAAGLAAWFARAESHVTRLRRRLATLGDPWRDPPDPAPWTSKSGPLVRGTDPHSPKRGQAPVGPGKRPRGYKRRNHG